MTSAEEKYGDIINLSWDSKHPRMDLQQRAKIFAPFAAFRGHSDRLQDEVNKTTRTLRHELSKDEMNVLSAKMTQVKKGMENDSEIILCAEFDKTGKFVTPFCLPGE